VPPSDPAHGKFTIPMKFDLNGDGMTDSLVVDVASCEAIQAPPKDDIDTQAADCDYTIYLSDGRCSRVAGIVHGARIFRRAAGKPVREITVEETTGCDLVSSKLRVYKFDGQRYQPSPSAAPLPCVDYLSWQWHNPVREEGIDVAYPIFSVFGSNERVDFNQDGADDLVVRLRNDGCDENEGGFDNCQHWLYFGPKEKPVLAANLGRVNDLWLPEGQTSNFLSFYTLRADGICDVSGTISPYAFDQAMGSYQPTSEPTQYCTCFTPLDQEPPVCRKEHVEVP
jgi:hypothetical protein